MKNKKLVSLVMAVLITTSSTITVSAATIKDTSNINTVAVLPSASDIGGVFSNLSDAIKDALNNLTDVVKKYTTSYKELPTKYDVPKTKNFEVKFNRTIDFISVNSSTVKVVDSEGNEMSVKLTPKSTDNTVLIVEAPTGGYKEGGTYALIIRKGINSLNSFKLVDETVMKFVIAGGSSTGGTTPGSGSSTTEGIQVISNSEILVSYSKDIKKDTFNTSNISLLDKDSVKHYIQLSFPNSKQVKINVSAAYPLTAGIYTIKTTNLKYSDGSNISSDNKSIQIGSGTEESILDVVKAFNGGRLYQDSYFNFYASESKDYYEAGGWYKVQQAYQNKYANNAASGYITDIDYYKKMQGLTINFDKVNNENTVCQNLYIKGVSIKTLGIPISGFLHKELNLYASTFVWRPDIEQEFALLINEERRKLGLSEVKLDTNLTAIAKWAAKRQHLTSTFYEYQKLPWNASMDTEDYLKGEYSDIQLKYPTSEERANGVEGLPAAPVSFKIWPENKTPFLSKESVPYYNDSNYYGYNPTLDNKYYNTELRDEFYNYFDYATKDKVYVAKYNTVSLFDARGFMERFKKNPYLGYTAEKSFRPTNYIGDEEYYKNEGYCIVDIMKIITNPTIKEIGIGCLYQSPTGKGNLNGMTGMYFIAR